MSENAPDKHAHAQRRLQQAVEGAFVALGAVAGLSSAFLEQLESTPGRVALTVAVTCFVVAIIRALNQGLRKRAGRIVPILAMLLLVGGGAALALLVASALPADDQPPTAMTATAATPPYYSSCIATVKRAPQREHREKNSDRLQTGGEPAGADVTPPEDEIQVETVISNRPNRVVDESAQLTERREDEPVEQEKHEIDTAQMRNLDVITAPPDVVVTPEPIVTAAETPEPTVTPAATPTPTPSPVPVEAEVEVEGTG